MNPPRAPRASPFLSPREEEEEEEEEDHREEETFFMTGATPLWNPHFIETLEGSFSSVSTATIARVGAFFRIFQDLQDLHSFAPLRTQNF